jgi:hypothetical protein
MAVVFEAKESWAERAAEFGVACGPPYYELEAASDDAEESPLGAEAPAEEECWANMTTGISRKAIEARRERRIIHL